ncbi:MAG: biotin/lipoyl-binding protein [Muribaculaceae bacterium]|nr:biotin/lipoyl-binding protein [Muribaculaceae bacterium]
MKEYKYKINGNVYKVGVGDIENGIANIEVNGTPYKVELEKTEAAPVKVAKVKPAEAPKGAEKPVKPVAAAPTGGYQIKAPLPGVILSIPVKVGDEVKASDTVLILEAMKMENAIHAGRDGKVASISVSQGDSVLEGAVLITLA